LRYALIPKGRNIVYNPYPIRSIHLNQKIPEKRMQGQTAQKTRGTSFFRSPRIFFPPRKKNKY
jgi:hypothetical protein